MPYYETVHEIREIQGKKKLVGYHPKLTIHHKGEQVTIQHGTVWRLDGTPVNDLPDWFYDQLKNIDAKALDDVEWTGHRKPGPKPKTQKVEPEKAEKVDG